MTNWLEDGSTVMIFAHFFGDFLKKILAYHHKILISRGRQQLLLVWHLDQYGRKKYFELGLEQKTPFIF